MVLWWLRNVVWVSRSGIAQSSMDRISISSRLGTDCDRNFGLSVTYLCRRVNTSLAVSRI